MMLSNSKSSLKFDQLMKNSSVIFMEYMRSVKSWNLALRVFVFHILTQYICKPMHDEVFTIFICINYTDERFEEKQIEFLSNYQLSYNNQNVQNLPSSLKQYFDLFQPLILE